MSESNNPRTAIGSNTPDAIDGIRAHYKAQGYDVRITRDGHVTYRPSDHVPYGVGCEWLEGRWISEYREIDGRIVLT